MVVDRAGRRWLQTGLLAAGVGGAVLVGGAGVAAAAPDDDSSAGKRTASDPAADPAAGPVLLSLSKGGPA